MFKLTLFAKIFLIGITCLLLSLWGVTLVNIYTFQASYVENLQLSARGVGMLVELDIKTALRWDAKLTDVADDSKEYIANFFAHDEFKSILTKYAIVDTHGRYLSSYDINLVDTHVSVEVLRAIEGITRPITLRRAQSYDTYIPIVLDANLYGYILIGFTARIVDQYIERALWEAVYVTAIALVLAALAFGVAISYYITRPLHNLIEKMSEIKQSGNLTTQIKVNCHDEMRDVAVHFNAMTSALHQTFQSVEHQVAERTQSLAEANQALIEAKQKAEKANATKGEFVASISHELRTPMNGILGMTELLLASETPPAERRQQLKIIFNSGKLLLDLINDLLDVSKLEAGKIELSPHDFDLFQHSQEILDLLSARAQQSQLELTLVIDPEVAQFYHADSHRLRQVLLNLIGNGLKFTQAGGVTLNIKQLQQDTNTATLLFQVIDTGIGIPEEKLNQLFGKFNQVNSDTSQKYGGTGLGLFISKQLIELMGGTIGVESKEGYGSTFWFQITLPVIDGNRLSKPACCDSRSPSSKSKLQRYRLLLVEDNVTNQKVASLMLKKLGYTQVTVVGDGKQAVSLTEKNDFDLILMDVQMPILDGYSATRFIRTREQKTGKHTCIIAMTANTSLSDKQNSLEAGMDDFITKPISQEALCKTLQQWLVKTSETHA